VAEFISNEGFGVGRTPRVRASKKYIEIPVPAPVSQPIDNPTVEPSHDAATPPLVVANETNVAPGPKQESLSTLHANGFTDFANPERFGYFHDAMQTIGFIPHAFSGIPQLPENEPANARWQIGRLELVSLLKHKSPRVYQSDNLPSMENLDAIATRELDDFEVAGLDKLRRGEEIVVDSGEHEIRMLGSVRALRQCLECHSANRGDLLGAFTYRIIRDPPVAGTAPPRVEVPAF
jgi:hypothetical protein